MNLFENLQMMKESNDKSERDIERKLISLVQDNLPGPLADRAGSSYFYTKGEQHFMAIPISPYSDSFDFYSYAKDLKKVFPKLPIYSMMDDYEMVIDVTRFYRELKESNHNEIKEDYNSDNAGTFLNILEDEIENAAKKYMISKCGFSEDEVDDYLTVTTDVNDDAVVIHVGAELSYESLCGLGEELNKIIEVHDKDAYFEPEIPGRLVAYLCGIKNESIDKLEESNHNEIFR